MSDISRSMRWLLGLLIATNVALLTVVVLFMARPFGAFAPDRPQADERLDTPAWLRESLPPEQRRLLEGVFERHRGDIREQARERQQARRDLGALMRRPQIDKDELNAAFARLRDAEHDLAEKTQTALAEVLVELEPRHRMRVARMIMAGRGRAAERQRERFDDRMPRDRWPEDRERRQPPDENPDR